MPKNIIICCDGTNNQIARDLTNVLRTYKVASRTPTQLTFYDCGVGTLPVPWAGGQLGQKLSLLKGLASGAGFMDNITDAYRFLMSCYEEGDKIFLFGFSRGAFTARALAGMLNSVGLLRPESENLVRYAQKYWQKIGHGSVCSDFKAMMSRPCPVHFVGVWDTVGSVGYPNQFRTFPYTMENPGVQFVRHAVAIDERRCFFRQNLMFASKSNPHQSIKNVWFAGVHSDVGGGYPAQEAGLPKIAFEWMMREAVAAGMQVNQASLSDEINLRGAPPDYTAQQHESLKGAWLLAELLPVKSYNWDSKQKEWRLPLGAARNAWRHADRPEVFLHQSVIDRIKTVASYRPPNIEHTELELRKRFKIES